MLFPLFMATRQLIMSLYSIQLIQRHVEYEVSKNRIMIIFKRCKQKKNRNVTFIIVFIEIPLFSLLTSKTPVILITLQLIFVIGDSQRP